VQAKSVRSDDPVNPVDADVATKRSIARDMSRFIILPPREVIEHHLATFVGGWLPGVPLPVDLWQTLLNAAIGYPTDDSPFYVIHRCELPSSGSIMEDVMELYGAESGDEIIEITPGQLQRTSCL
jgi:hypothetical protein